MDPVSIFIADLERLGLHPTLEAELVRYTIEAVDGARADTAVATAVSVAELGNWPLVPPHWIHFPSDLTLSRTNSQSSTLAGWTMHSRQIVGWGRDDSPGSGWAAHVRGVLTEAIA